MSSVNPPPPPPQSNNEQFLEESVVLIDIEECKVKQCTGACAVVKGSEKCSCAKGYQLDAATALKCEGKTQLIIGLLSFHI